MGNEHKKNNVKNSRAKTNTISSKGESKNHNDLKKDTASLKEFVITNESFEDYNDKENNKKHATKETFVKNSIKLLKEFVDKKQVASSLLCTLITASIIKMGSFKTFIEYMLSSLFNNANELLEKSKIPNTDINLDQIIMNYYPIIFKTTTYLIIILILYIIYKFITNLLIKYSKHIESKVPLAFKFSIAPFVLLATHFLPIILYSYFGNYLLYLNITREFKGILVVLYISLLLYIEFLILDLNKELSIKYDNTLYSSFSKINFVIVLYCGIISMITFIISLVIISFNTNRSIVAITYGLSSTIGYLLYYSWSLIYRFVYLKAYSIKGDTNSSKAITGNPKLSIIFCIIFCIISILSVIGFIIFLLTFNS